MWGWSGDWFEAFDRRDGGGLRSGAGGVGEMERSGGLGSMGGGTGAVELSLSLGESGRKKKKTTE